MRWKKRPYPRSPSYLHRTSLLFVLFSIFLFLSYKHFCTSTLCTSPNPPPSRFCNSPKTLAGQKFLWYAPHSGFSNQLSEFRNALLIAAILNRTLIVPPVLDHHAVALGSCPKFRVLNPNELRFSVWKHIIDLIHSRRQLIRVPPLCNNNYYCCYCYFTIRCTPFMYVLCV